jgi:pyruvate dehydrogenase E1 component alpha subunit
MSNFNLDVFKKTSLCRHFENETYKKIQSKVIKFPVYLSAGQEYAPSTIAEIVEKKKIKPDIFVQHRCHSTYLAFGGRIEEIIDELLGKESGCSGGMGGSASIQCRKKKIFGHDGLMGSQVPIAVGACFASKKPTIVFVGDSAAEEDYVLSAIGWAATKKLPILFIVEDNDLSILTEKKVRRSWHIHKVAKGFGVEAFNISDDPNVIRKHMLKAFSHPLLLNINTKRKYWHAGAGDDGKVFDRYEYEKNLLGKKAEEIDKKK